MTDKAYQVTTNPTYPSKKNSHLCSSSTIPPPPATIMNSKLNYMNKSPKTNTTNSFWNWKKGPNSNNRKRGERRLSVTGFLQDNGRKTEAAAVLGPGGGVGVGCGAGVGFGLVGGVGYGGWPWNHVRMVFGVGMGCGLGVGFGYGHGFGFGFSLDSLEDYFSEGNSDSNKGIVIQI
ncbi:hypothetical protein CsSME_00005403 [Camellia sinensis var. sinensis]